MDKRIVKNIVNSVVIVICMISLLFLYKFELQRSEERKNRERINENISKIFSEVDVKNNSKIDTYTVYGNHLNLKGSISRSYVEGDIDSIYLHAKNLDGEDLSFELKYNLSDESINFYTSDEINDGINLDNISSGEYYIFLDVKSQDKDSYFGLTDNTKYNENVYYTITKNGNNNKIDIVFKTRNNVDYMYITSNNSSLPTNVVDFVIDAGHGGSSSGAVNGEYKESEFTLKYSIALKEKLEKLGYKVALTRDSDIDTPSYGINGRAVMPYLTKAKLILSIHLNSSVTPPPHGGVEVYAPNHANLTFAKSIADNIVNMVNVNYSVNSYARVEEGVYVRTYSQEEVEDAKKYAQYAGYTPYESLTTDTPYLFMIRETGGIMTRAYVDGRNTSIGTNPYYDSNIAAEGYLLELGFINSDDDLQNIINNEDKYIDAIIKSIEENYNNGGN